jgi:hypothetical protein
MEIWTVRLLPNVGMLYGMLLPMLCRWTDICRHGPWGSLLWWKLGRQLLFVLYSGHAVTRHRCDFGSTFPWIHCSSTSNSDSLPDEVRNQEEVQYPWRWLRGLLDCLVLRLLRPCAGTCYS